MNPKNREKSLQAIFETHVQGKTPVSLCMMNSVIPANYSYSYPYGIQKLKEIHGENLIINDPEAF